jgi:hypothetical protein
MWRSGRNTGWSMLLYIDLPVATRQDFMKDKEKAYRDKVLRGVVYLLQPRLFPPAYGFS